MTPRFGQLFGLRTTRTLSGGQVSSVDVLTTAETNSLTLVNSVNGDKKAPNPHSYRNVRQGAWIGSMLTRAVNGLSYQEIMGPLPWTSPGVGTNPINSNNLFNEALSDVYSRIRGDLNLGQTLAEYPQLVQMKQSAERLETILTSNTFGRQLAEVKRQHGSRAFRVPMRKISRLWLTFQFGIRPILSDVYNLGKQLSRADPEFMKVRVRKHASETVNLDIPFPGYPAIRAYGKVEWSSRVELSTRWAMKASVAQQIAGYTTLNPISLAWELFPFSFLVDYVYDIGGYMSNVENAILYGGGTQFLNGYATTGTLAVLKLECNGTHQQSNLITTISAKASERLTTFNRSVLSSAPFPKAPGFNSDLSSTRMLNCAALLGNLLR